MADPLIVQAYSSQSGGDLPYFIGGGIQEGAGWLRTLGRYAFPILQRIFNVAQNTAEDVLVKEQPILKSLGANAMQEVDKLVRGKGTTLPSKSLSGKSFTIRKRARKRTLTLPPLFTKKKRRKKRR